jgi:DNA-binding transcriptional LysR family regulator
MNDRFQELRLFVRAAESGSFSAAAREMGLSQPSVSRIVSELEARLGVRLLLRTTRKIVPTEAGNAYLKKAKQLLLDLEEADEAARGGGSLKGTLRVAVSETLCIRTIIPNLQDFLDGHPQLKLEFLTADVMHDLIAEGVDMAIRFGPLPDSGFGVKKLATLKRLLLASPSYIERHGEPKTPAELGKRDCIFGPTGVPTQPWEFTQGAEKISVKVDPRYSFTSAEALIACAREGLGIARASALMCKRELESGQLLSLLGDFRLAPVEIHAVFPAGRMPSQKARSFTEFLSGVFAETNENK